MMKKEELCFFCNEAIYGDYNTNVLAKLDDIDINELSTIEFPKYIKDYFTKKGLDTIFAFEEMIWK